MIAAGFLARVLVTGAFVLPVIACTAGQTPDAAPDQSRPCAAEDSPGPCYWDASTRGNGHGQSFRVDQSGTVHYLAPSEVSR